MILLRNKKLIFLKPRKVAGTSFEIALSRYAQPEDIVTPIIEGDENTRREMGFSGPANFMGNDGSILFKNHISALDAKRRIGSEWPSLLKVSIIRNPFDVYVSLFFYKNGAQADILTLSDWYIHGDGGAYLGANCKQYFIGGKLIIDRFIRYENLQEDIRDLENACPGLDGLCETFQKIKSKSGFRPAYSHDLAWIYARNEQLRLRIERLHGFEIARFGYALR